MSLSFPQLLQLISFSCLLAAGQTLFKLSAVSTPNIMSLSGLFLLAQNLWFWAALSLYGISTLLWIYILQNIPLSIAYPFVALGFIFVPAIAWAFFKEPINIYYGLGVFLILFGLGLITVLGAKAS